MPTLTSTRQPLADLINSVRDRTGMTYRDLAARAVRRGHRISYSQINNYALNAAAKIPDDDLIQGLAAALDVSPEVVLTAAIEQYYSVEQYRSEGGVNDVVIPADATESQRAAIKAMLEAMFGQD